MIDVIALGELLIDFACLNTDADGYPTMAAHPGGAPANFLAALGSPGLGSFLHVLLVIGSAPMVCSNYWVLSLFLWAVLLVTSLQKRKET